MAKQTFQDGAFNFIRAMDDGSKEFTNSYCITLDVVYFNDHGYMLKVFEEFLKIKPIKLELILHSALIECEMDVLISSLKDCLTLKFLKFRSLYQKNLIFKVLENNSNLTSLDLSEYEFDVVDLFDLRKILEHNNVLTALRLPSSLENLRSAQVDLIHEYIVRNNTFLILRKDDVLQKSLNNIIDDYQLIAVNKNDSIKTQVENNGFKHLKVEEDELSDWHVIETGVIDQTH